MCVSNFDETERAWCPSCGVEHEYVRPGKTQPVCDCDETCPIHGRNMIVYHSAGEVPRLSGYFCKPCWVTM